MEHRNAVLVGLEEMKKYDGCGNGIVYSINGVDYTTDEMIEAVKNETDVGREFSQMVYNSIISYMGKFNPEH